MRLDWYKPCMHACMSGFNSGGGEGAKYPASRKEREVVGEGEHMVAEKDTVCGIH